MPARITVSRLLKSWATPPVSRPTASILSKKLAEGIDALVLDVKVGRGAFMTDETSARALAESLVRVGSGAGLDVRAYLTKAQAESWEYLPDVNGNDPHTPDPSDRDEP